MIKIDDRELYQHFNEIRQILEEIRQILYEEMEETEENELPPEAKIKPKTKE